MTSPSAWDARIAIAKCNVTRWEGHAWRFHASSRSATDSSGSLRLSGRFNQGQDLYSDDECWAALYLALAPEVALAELIRHLGENTMHRLKNRRLSTIDLELSHVVDCRDPDVLGVNGDDLFADNDFNLGHAIAHAAFALGIEGMLVKSATLLGDNLVVFDANLHGTSRISVIEYVDPRLYVENPR